MIEHILKNIADLIRREVPAISTAGGAARSVLLRSGDRVRRVPAMPGSDLPGYMGDDYIELIPADADSAVAFWQVLSSEINPSQRGRHGEKNIPMVARCRLVIWGNKKRLSPPDVSHLVGECINIIRENLSDIGEDWIQGINFEVTGLGPRDPGVFAEYGFDEEETQFVTEPYDFASATFEFHFSYMLNCLPSVGAVEPY